MVSVPSLFHLLIEGEPSSSNSVPSLSSTSNRNRRVEKELIKK